MTENKPSSSHGVVYWFLIVFLSALPHKHTLVYYQAFHYNQCANFHQAFPTNLSNGRKIKESLRLQASLFFSPFCLSLTLYSLSTFSFCWSVLFFSTANFSIVDPATQTFCLALHSITLLGIYPCYSFFCHPFILCVLFHRFSNTSLRQGGSVMLVSHFRSGRVT